MQRITLELPESLFQSIAELAAQEGYSVEQFLASAAAEKLAAIRTVDYLRQEAKRGNREDFLRFLEAVPAREPVDTDLLP